MKYLSFLFLLVSFQLASQNECGLSIQHIEWGECSGDFIEAHIGVTAELPSSTFTVYVDGDSYGTFEYGQDNYVLYEIIADCMTNYEFLVIDNGPDSCSTSLIMQDLACCGFGCELAGVNIADTICLDSLIAPVFEAAFFENDGITDFIDVYIDGNFYETVSQAAFPLSHYELLQGTEYIFTFCESDAPDCCFTVDVPAFSCYNGPVECHLDEAIIQPYVCMEDSLGYVLIEFETPADSEAAFSIVVGDEIYTRTYGDTYYEIGPVSYACGDFIEVYIFEDNNDVCNTSAVVEAICCDTDCYMPAPTWSGTDCNEEYFIIYDLVVTEYLSDFENITLYLNGQAYFDLIKDESITLNIPQNLIDEIFVLSFQIEDFCSVDIDLYNSCYNQQGGDCQWEGAEWEVEDCNDQGLFAINIYYGIDNPSSDQFYVLFDGDSRGPFSYNPAGFVRIEGIPGNCDVLYDFTLIDANDPCCSYTFSLQEPVCCQPIDCFFGEYSVGEVTCDDNSIFFWNFNVEHSGASDSFNVVVGGVNIVATFAYSDLPVDFEFSNFITNGPSIDLMLCDQEYEMECFNNYQIDNPCYESDGCPFTWLTLEAVECYEGMFYALITYESEATEGSFSVVGNGNDYGDFDFNSSNNVIIGPLAADCETLYEFVLIHNEIEDCQNETYFVEPICCDEDCMLEYGYSEYYCNDSILTIVGLTVGGSNGDNYHILYDDVYLGLYDFSEPIDFSLAIPNIQEGTISFEICDGQDESCCITAYFDIPCDGDFECNIEITDYTIFDCNAAGEFDVLLTVDVDFPIGEGIQVFGNGNDYGFFDYPISQIYIQGLDPDCETLYEFVLVDTEVESCFEVLEFEEPVCCGDLPACSIESVGVEYFACEEGVYFVAVTTQHEGLGTEYNLYLDNEYQGTHDYDGTIELGPFQGSESDTHDLLLIDTEDPTCSMHVYFGQECDEFVEEDEEDQLYNPDIQYLIHDNSITFDNPDEVAVMRIFDPNGKTIERYPSVNDYTMTFEYPAGIYFLEMIGNNKRITAKMVISR